MGIVSAIACPHCTTSYNIDADKLGEGRTVRCARCKETWFAKPQRQFVMAGEVEWTEAPDLQTRPEPARSVEPAPIENIESPPLAAEMPEPEQVSTTGRQLVAAHSPAPGSFIDAMPTRSVQRGRRKTDDKPSGEAKGFVGLPIAAAAMAALVGALIFWRGDVVKLLPQTALLYRSVGLDVNLRGLSFRDVKLGHETVDGKPVLVIEGVIIDELKRPLEVPKIRFVVRDARGTAIYAWTANAEQTVIEPGQRVAFRSRLAAPPDEAHAIDVRFFHKRDLSAGTG